MRIAMISRLIPDRFVLLLLAAVLLGWLLPVSGQGLAIAQDVSFVSIFALFFLHGLRLPRQEVVKAARSWKVQGAMLAFSFVALPLAGLALAKGAGWMLPAALATGLVYCAMLPSTVQSAISYSSMGGGNVAASVVGAALSNLSGIILTPALVALMLGAASGVTIGSDTIIRIATMLLLPFALGQIAQCWLGGWAQRQKAMLSFFDRLVILIAVYVAFAGAVNSGSLSALDLGTMATLCALLGVLLAFAFAGAWFFGRLLGLDRADRISLVFAGAQKSIATGAPMAAILFGSSAGLIVLPAIIYHMAQLLLSAPLAARFARSH
ncbi:bile acid:sodium symporter family protein [Sphingorhabdus sp.]|jgi:sodium/bile acid cotransporter 7|uniref:bile acid:sodium symporter family protein n=1 Tax=Sphingorhabdus sp. TaxID=1902408 RepID=UPI002C20A78F|nr:bile acid:sodium symporter family protein [Sphingorhabdus sp.]HMT40604.1 bile acid:sodium symporter family protein [Sphingorhabdus sp.]